MVYDRALETGASRLYLIDFPRAANAATCAGFWSAMESIKNGWAWDDRYKFKEIYFDCPNVWVFTNTLPDERVLTGDRWAVWVIVDGILRNYEGGVSGAAL